MTSEEPLKLVLKCIDHEEHGKLYALNKEISNNYMEKIKPYFKKYGPNDFKDVMKIDGNPYGWMCKEENTQKVEEILQITETLTKQAEDKKERQKELDKEREIKDQAMTKIEEKFSGAPRPSKFLKKLLKKADIVYDYIWYIINNGREDDDYSINNIKTSGPGAVGFRVPYDDELHELIKIFSNENIYKGF